MLFLVLADSYIILLYNILIATIRPQHCACSRRRCTARRPWRRPAGGSTTVRLPRRTPSRSSAARTARRSCWPSSPCSARKRPSWSSPPTCSRPPPSPVLLPTFRTRWASPGPTAMPLLSSPPTSAHRCGTFGRRKSSQSRYNNVILYFLCALLTLHKTTMVRFDDKFYVVQSRTVMSAFTLHIKERTLC